MKPRLLKWLAYALLLGALANYAVAWTIALTRDPPSGPSRVSMSSSSSSSGSNFSVRSSTNSARGGLSISASGASFSMSSSGVTGARRPSISLGNSPNSSGTFSYTTGGETPGWHTSFKADQHKEPNEPAKGTLTAEWKMGWPFIALRAWHSEKTESPNINQPTAWPQIPSTLTSGLYITNTTGDPSGDRRLPFIPALPGFLYNTLLFAAPIYLLGATFIIYRERTRKKHGQCLHCGYQVNDLPLCPECGQPNAWYTPERSDQPEPASPSPDRVVAADSDADSTPRGVD